MFKVTASMIKELTHSATGGGGGEYSDRKFKSLFGATPLIISKIWELMLSQSETNKNGVTCKDLLLAHFLKTYATEDHISNLFGNTSKTFREKYKEALFILADLDIICF